MRKSIIQRRTRTMIGHHRRKAKEAGQVLDYDLVQLRALVEAAIGNPCPYCGQVLRHGNFGVDHMHPLGRQGLHALANLAVVCMPCNERKGGLSDEEYSAIVKLAANWPPEAQRSLFGRLRAGSKVCAGR